MATDYEAIIDAAVIDLEANEDYESSGSLTKAYLFKQAVGKLMLYRPSEMEHGGNQATRFDARRLAEMHKEVTAWIDANAASSSSSNSNAVTYSTFDADFRTGCN